METSPHQVLKVLGLVSRQGLQLVRVGVNTYSLLQTVDDEVEIAGGRNLAVGSREVSSIKSAVPKLVVA